MNKLIKKYEKELAKNYKKGLDKLKREVGNFYETYKSVEKEIKKYNRGNYFKDLTREILQEVYSSNNKLILRALKDIVSCTFKDVEKEYIKLSDTDMDSLKGIKFDFDVTKIVNDDMSGLNWRERQYFNREKAIKQVQQTLISGFNQGLRYEEMARDLSKRIDTDMYSASRIIRTEGHRCLNQSKLESYQELKKSGAKIKKKWLSSEDERVRDSHSELNGQVVDVDKPFKFRGYEAMAPGLFGVPELDINCRCVMTMVVE